MSTSPYPLLDTLQLFYDTEARLLICTQESCKFALSNAPSQVVAHLRDKHHISTEARKGLHRLLKSLSPTPLDPHRVPLPADGSARHDKLQVYEGFVCLNCPFRTISAQLARRHQSNPPEDCSSGISHTRAVRRRDLDQQFECVYLQTWTTGSTRRYWIIKHRGSIVRQVDSPAVQGHLRSVLTREFNRGKVPNEMTAAPPVAPADITSFALQTPWLDRTGWHQTYNNKDRREVLVALTRTFTAPGGREHHIGPGQQYGLDQDLVSPGGDEDKIACLIRLVDLLICRKQLQFLDAIWKHEALGDLATLEELTGRYKRSAGHTQATAGLGVRGQTTEEEVGDNYEEEESEEDEMDDEMDDEENEEEVDIDDSENNNDQEPSRDGQRSDNYREEDEGFTTWLDNLGEITDEEEYSIEAEEGAAPGSPEELIQLLGILGFSSSPDGSAFLPARSYTSNLSGLVYILRLLFLEYALPLQAYPNLGLKRRPHVGQLERLQSIRRRYMVMESHSPMEELLSLRNYGQVMSRTDTPPHLLRWSEEGQVVSLGEEISISMSQFRRLPDHFVTEATKLCDEMMFSWDPAIDLSRVSDNMVNNREGFSFVLHPENKLDTAYLELFDRASKAHRNGLFRGNGWDWSAVFTYFKKEEALLGAILGGMFFARFLPAQLGHILYKYLVYIRPFINMLHRERGSPESGQATESHLLFREDATPTSRSWQTGRLTATMKTSTSLVWGQPINSRQFHSMTAVYMPAGMLLLLGRADTVRCNEPVPMV
ncbi:unnamed protein product [Fusarium graminearum]|nr:unnamed protein product [Fusarium graminearum]